MGGGAGNEVDFMIHGIVKYHLFGQELWLTTTTVGMTVITIVLLILAFVANRTMKKATEVPGTFQNILELGIEMLENMTFGILRGNGKRFANYIGTIFLFILFCNLSGLFGLRTVTADFGVTFLLGLVTFGIVQYQGIKNHGVGHFMPSRAVFAVSRDRRNALSSWRISLSHLTTDAEIHEFLAVFDACYHELVK